MIEVLVALVVLSLLVLGLSQGVRTGLALRQAQIQRLAETTELDAAMRLLRTVLTRLPLVAEGHPGIESETSSRFLGEADSVSFFSRLPTGLGTSRRAAMTLFVRSGRLVLSWTPRRHELPLGPPPQATETELLQGVARLDLAYWGPRSADQEAGWQSRWEALEAPQLIRIRLAFADNDRRRWPDLIAAPRP